MQESLPSLVILIIVVIFLVAIAVHFMTSMPQYVGVTTPASVQCPPDTGNGNGKNNTHSNKNHTK